VISAAALAGYALVLALVVPRRLRDAAWPVQAPRLGVAAWQVVSVSMVVAPVLAGLSLAVPASVFSHGLADLLRSCAMAVRSAYATPGGAAAAGTGIVLAGAVSSRVAYCTTRALRQAARRRQAHSWALELVGRRDAALGVTVVEADGAIAYCLPGTGRIVLSTGALTALGPAELRAVLAHERAHLGGRHHLVLAGADALAQAFPSLALFRIARDEIARLLEMLADDAAARRQDRLTVAGALARMAGAQTPSGAFGAGGSTALTRVRRLLAPARPLGVVPSAVVGLALAGLLIAPAVLAALPAAHLVGRTYCPVPMVRLHAVALAASAPAGSVL
jgi:Zn-dependent protease with chaperone function